MLRRSSGRLRCSSAKVQSFAERRADSVETREGSPEKGGETGGELLYTMRA
jgi:hypothetical protein